MKKVLSVIFKRAVIVSFLLAVQLVFTAVMIFEVTKFSTFLYVINSILSISGTIYILNDDERPTAYKLVWVLLILALPIFGISFFLLYGADKTSIRRQKKMKVFNDQPFLHCKQNSAVAAKLRDEDKDSFRISSYLFNQSYWPAYQNTQTVYFASGEEKFERLKWELESAQHFIFLEYFIIEEGYMWGQILDVLKRKAAQGVDVRVIYDDFGCISKKLPYPYTAELAKFGIKAIAFNQFIPVMTTRLNNRDHRKICVIDGHTGFTGGINLADEYINKVVRFGKWKDTAVMLKGDAVWSFTVMFLSMWEYASGNKEEYENYRPDNFSGFSGNASDGFVQPFTDCPHDNEPVTETVYMDIISKAKDYVYISTPYLIIDSEMETALKNAAKSGVDVRIITPHIPDKKLVFQATRASYLPLIQAGVKIYEYTPGFIHAKMFVSDDRLACVGTANMDFRSLFLHFECGALMYKCSTVFSVKADFLDTFKVSQIVTETEMRKRPWYTKMIGALLKIVAPLL